jgi:hypothetical protein
VTDLVRRSALTLLVGLATTAGTSACIPADKGPGELFTDVTESAGIDFEFVGGATGERYLVEIMAGGVGWIDYDGDGDYDLYAVNGHANPLAAVEVGEETNRLYRNDGGRFTDVTEAAGVGDRHYGMGLAVGDYDGDGDADLLVTNYGRNTLYRNDGNGSFSDVTEAAGITEQGFNTSAAWFDMDGDRDLDLYIVRYLDYDPRTSRRCQDGGLRVYCNPRYFAGKPDLLYRNRGDGTFESIGKQAGIDKAGAYEGKGLGVVTFDADRDGLLDIYVANDMTPNFLWRARGDGTYEDVAHVSGVALSGQGHAQAGMGVDVGDVNADGLTDIYVTNFAKETNALYVARVAGRFTDAVLRSGLGPTLPPLGFGTLFTDVDLDGDADIVTVNGHVNDVVEQTDPGAGMTFAQRPDLFLNNGEGLFERGTDVGGSFFAEPVVGRALAPSDYDDDGDVDLAVGTLDRSVRLLRNNNPHGHSSVTVKLVGTTGARDGYGARVEAHGAGRLQTFEVQSARSYLSAADPRVVIGLGEGGKLERLTVRWPGGSTQELTGGALAGERIEVVEPGAG